METPLKKKEHSYKNQIFNRRFVHQINMIEIQVQFILQ
jgi:hypothetical protein